VTARRLRLGVYTDMVFRQDGTVVSTDLSFILFLAALAPHLREVVLFGRLDPVAARSHYELPKQGVRLVPFPYYPRVTSVGRVVRSLFGARVAFVAELEHLDAVWLFGPHPLALYFARVARRHRVPVFLGIRQDFPTYIGGRLPSRAWLWAVPVAHALEYAFRRLSRVTPTVVVGDELARVYSRAGGPLLATTVSLVRDEDIADVDRVLERPWNGELRVLSVGRLEAEKNPLLLPEILARLRRRYEGWRMTVVGSGPLTSAVQNSAEKLGVSAAFELKGYVPFGPGLWEIYRASHAFLHVSLTEGLPQVLLEAEAAGLPIVATDVGGVRSALRDGELGLVVPPRDADAVVDALERLRTHSDLRRQLIERGLVAIRETTLDAEVRRVVEFFGSQLEAV
jgi:glycosyltransferase involved in cell wall biosynthesis